MLPTHPRSWPLSRRLRAFLVFIALVAVLSGGESRATGPAGPTGPQDPGDDPWTLCARHVAEIEVSKGLPPHLLSAISKVESGRWVASQQTVHAWPWTVTSGAEGRFFATLEEALSEVEAIRASGRRNIDVGCMQVNLLHHPDAFEDLRAAFDPATNVAYAADLLTRLKKEARSWPKAIAYYHSRKPSFNGPYRRKVFRAWHEEWHRAGLAPRFAYGEEQRDPLAALVNFGGGGEAKTEARLGQLQLGAFRRAENAYAVWAKLWQENPTLLGDLRPRIDVVHSGNAGPMHFLRVSPVMNVKLAQSICNELLDRAVDCLVVDPPRRLALNGDVQHLR